MNDETHFFPDNVYNILLRLHKNFLRILSFVVHVLFQCGKVQFAFQKQMKFLWNWFAKQDQKLHQQTVFLHKNAMPQYKNNKRDAHYVFHRQSKETANRDERKR